MRKRGETRQEILRLLKDDNLSPSDLRQNLGTSLSVVHRHLQSLLRERRVEKIGSGPHVCYTARNETADDVVEKHFLFQDPLGVLRFGIDGFRLWSERGLKKLPFEEKISLFAKQFLIMESGRKDGVFDLTEKLKSVVSVGESAHLKEMVCLSLRSMKDFGRTKLGVYMDAVKSAGNKEATEELLRVSVPSVIAYAKRKRINAVGFIPPTRKRRADQQIMRLVEERFQKGPFRASVIDIKKVPTKTPREQKTIRDLRDRVHNANYTFRISSYAHVHNYKRILLVDDVIGSGATLNQVAKMLKKRKFTGEVFGFGIVGEEYGYSVERIS